MVDDEKEAAPIEDGKARWPRIFQKKLTDITQFVKVCTLPSETQYWKMYLIGSGGNPPASFFVKVAYTDNPGEDEWFPIFPGAEDDWRRTLPKHIFAEPLSAAGPQSQNDILIIESWGPRMPAEFADKEKSRLGNIGARQK
jgi:hypothetical protein